MSACSFHKLVITNPVPTLNPTGPMSTLGSQSSCPIAEQYSLTDPNNPIGRVPYSGQATPERTLFNEYWQDMVKNHGVRVKYWRHGFDFTKADTLYGEQPTAQYADSDLLAGVAEMTNNSTTLQRFGFQATSDVKLLIAIPEFARVYGSMRPKSDDLFTLVDMYNDRPDSFGPRIFQVTYVDDEGPDTNILGGHYVWTIEAVRFQPSFEPNTPSETTQDLTLQVTEDSAIGLLLGGSTPKSPPKPYTQVADEESAADFDADYRGEDNDKIYGGY